MELSPEDALRLNVLLANEQHAIRINESSMTVYATSARGESSVKLNPTCRDEQYLKCVRELFSGHVMGSPGGYPVFLQRWTRMGQQREENLDQLLLLGEPEAVVAVVGAEGLTDELARRAWWAMEDAENGRCMLERECVVNGKMGPLLAQYLVEHLPFEEEAINMIRSIRLALQPGLLSDERVTQMWNQGRKKNAYLVGFLWGRPDDLPEPETGREDVVAVSAALADLAAAGNACAMQLRRTYSAQGQNFLATSAAVLKKPVNQDVVMELLAVIAHYFSTARPVGDPDAELEKIITDAESLCTGESALADPGGVADCLAACPAAGKDIASMLALSRLGYPVVRPVLARTTAIGSLMRRKLAPVTDQIQTLIDTLRQPESR